MKQKILCSLIKGLEKDCKIKDENTAIIYLIQIIDILKKEGFDVFHKTYEWVRYKKSRFLIDERLEEFNTTGLNLCAKKKKENLVISFGRADRMSNGERDVLSFVASLIAFEIQVKNKPGILIVDEVFDYLDGANLLAAQYYLSKMVENLRRKGKIIIPIIMTHLDPSVFASYSFKKMAVHYLTSKSNIDLDDCVVKMLLLRSQLKEHNHLQSSDYEKYLLHFHLDNWNIPEDILEQLPEGFPSNSNTWRDYLYREVEEKYLGGSDYNAPAVIIALRMKVEENTVRLLPENKREEYFSQHGSNNKLPYAESCNCDIPELFYLLQPLYNDSAHLRNGKWADKENRNKIESAYLKITSPIIRMMIQEFFQM